MDIYSLIIGAILTFASIFPFVYIGFKNKKANKIILDEFLTLVKKFNGNIAFYDLFNKKVIGLDQYSKRIFFYDNSSLGKKEIVIDLNKTTTCDVQKDVREINLKSDAHQIIEKIDLLFYEKSMATNLEFFNSNTPFSHLNGEVQLAEKWKKICEEEIKSNF